jgi:hypothetical protein
LVNRVRVAESSVTTQWDLDVAAIKFAHATPAQFTMELNAVSSSDFKKHLN